jgi:Ni,Fe-hydrogenase maturation factor
MDFPGQLEYRYQLQVEDAELISRADRVVFVDSYQGNLPGGFQWTPCEPVADVEFTSHVLPPGAILQLCRDLYGKSPPANLLLIQGRSWGLHTGLSADAGRHLGRAVQFLGETLSA